MASFQNYVVCFSDGRIKIGMTSNLAKRMSYYRQEAMRSGVQQITWWAAAAMAEKRMCLLMERLMCNSFKHLALTGRREWIAGSAAVYEDVIKQSEFIRGLLPGREVEKGESVGWWVRSGRIGVPA